MSVNATPIALQLLAVAHDTSVSWVANAPGGLGLGTIDQELPSQCSIRVGLVEGSCW